MVIPTGGYSNCAHTAASRLRISASSRLRPPGHVRPSIEEGREGKLEEKPGPQSSLPSPPLSHTYTHTLTHCLSHIHSHTYTQSHAYIHIPIYTYTYSHNTLTHRNTFTHSFLYYTCTHGTHTLILIYTCTHDTQYTYIQKHTHLHTYTRTHNIHTLTYNTQYTHTHILTRIHSYTYTLRPTTGMNHTPLAAKLPVLLNDL